MTQGDGLDKGKIVVDRAITNDKAEEQRLIVVHRARFLQQLLGNVPESIMHVNKKLVRIERDMDAMQKLQPELTLHFTDGSIHYADAVIGADGIHSYVRGHILGESHPATKPVYAGWWDCRNLVPIQRGIKKHWVKVCGSE